VPALHRAADLGELLLEALAPHPASRRRARRAVAATAAAVRRRR